MWSAFGENRLDELIKDDVLRIEIVLPTFNGTLTDEEILNHIVMPADEEPLSEPEETFEEDVVEEMPAIPDEPAPPVEEIPIHETAKQSEPEPIITVAESEPVREEREADSTDQAPPSPVHVGKMRVLGKRRPLGHPTRTAVDILMNESAFRDAQAHALSSLSREVAGMLIGPQPEKQPDGRYLVHITDAIIAKHTRMQGASVTYTPESWRYINDKLDEMYPDGDAVIVGWYHTHPGFGIFLSGMDLFIHQNFFTQIWHIAFVLDPIAHRTGFFCWDREKTAVNPYEFPWASWAKNSW